MRKITIALGFLFILTLFGINFALAPHSITICGITYVCGVADGVCPEDFPGFGTCDVPDPDCGATPPTGGGGISLPASIPTTNFVYNCTKDKEIDIFKVIQNSNIYSLDGFCLDLKVLNAHLVNNPTKAQLTISKANIVPKTNLSVYKTFKVNFSDDVNYTVFYFRVPGSWAAPVVKRSIALYTLNGNKLNTTYEGEKAGFYYYVSKINGGSGTYYIAGEKKPTIWTVIEKINEYYSGKISFVEIVETILDYYQ